MVEGAGKTVLVVVPRGWDIRSILRTGMLKPLRDAGIRTILVTPKAGEPRSGRNLRTTTSSRTSATSRRVSKAPIAGSSISSSA